MNNIKPIKAVIYARFSSDKQSDASIEDQIRICSQQAEKENWQVIMNYSDYAISGSSMHREGIQSLMANATNRQFDIVICEDLSRLSRDQENIAGIYKRLTFAGIQIYSLSDGGFINDLHIGLKGTMNSLFIKDLSQRTHRGQSGRALQGKFASGRAAYGYDIVRKLDSQGELIKGERKINEEQASIVRRIFTEYAKGKSPRTICMDLNKEGIVNGAGKAWSSTSLVGVRSKGTGMLNNELYIGKMIWNKRRLFKHPDTGNRIARMNPLEDRIEYELPELQIVSQELWDKVKAKQDQLSINSAPHTKRRPRALFSFLMECGCCGGGFSKISKNRYGCTKARKQGTCNNRITIAQDKLENAILSGLQDELMHDDLLAVFCEAFDKEMAILQKHQHCHKDEAKNTLAKLEKEKQSLIDAIKQGIPADEIKDEFTRIAQQREYAESLLTAQNEKPLILTPDMATIYRDEVSRLRETLQDDDARYEGTELIRSLIDKIVLIPDPNHKKRLKVNLYGNLTGMLSIASGQTIERDGVLVEVFERCQQAPLLHPPNEKQELKESGANISWLK